MHGDPVACLNPPDSPAAEPRSGPGLRGPCTSLPIAVPQPGPGFRGLNSLINQNKPKKTGRKTRKTGRKCFCNAT